MKILHVVHGMSRGGLETGVLHLARGLPRGAFEQAVCCLDRLGDLAAALPPQVSVVCLDRRQHRWSTAWRLARMLRDWQPDLVHCRNWNAWPETVLAHRLAPGSRRLVWSFHGFGDGDAMPCRRRVASRWLARQTDRLAAVCRHSADLYALRAGLDAARFEVLHNGVDTARLQPSTDRAGARQRLGLPPDRPLVLTVANLTPIKDHAALLEAAATLAASGAARPLFLWLGEGPTRAALQARIARLGLAADVLMPGSRHDVAPYLQAADLFVLPSRLEGMSNAILEAMACGLPVLARRVGANPELVLDGQTGLLCPAADAAAFATALARLLADGPLRLRLGEAGRRRAEANFSLDAMLARYADFYRQAAAASALN